MEVLRAVDLLRPGGPGGGDPAGPPFWRPSRTRPKYYKDYNKAKTAEQMLTIQLEKGDAGDWST